MGRLSAVAAAVAGATSLVNHAADANIMLAHPVSRQYSKSSVFLPW